MSNNFKDYATRVSFNVSLSRNQIGHLAGVVQDIELEYLNRELKIRAKNKSDAVADAGGNPALFVMGRGSLERMGLIVHDPRWLKANASEEQGAFWKYNGPMYQLTPAGVHMVELLRIAGLLPQAVDTPSRKRA